MTARWLDRLIVLLLFVAALWAYIDTLAPTVLDGDRALYQYTPYVLGVTYPTGFPVYILLGKVWVTLFAVGNIAWRMNMFSAVCASLTVPLIYQIGYHLWQNRLAALLSAIVLGTLPTFWLWATEAKTYTASLLALSVVLWLLTANNDDGGNQQAKPDWLGRIGQNIVRYRFSLAAFTMGVQVGIHNTAVLLLPGIVWLFLSVYRVNTPSKSMWSIWIRYAILFLIPISSYLYVPLRGEWLLATYGRDMVITRGLVADFYQSGIQGWLTYFTAAEFTGHQEDTPPSRPRHERTRYNIIFGPPLG
ncbi:MAG: DUF2723 domain-containing protein [Chloroflexota bacterium]